MQVKQIGSILVGFALLLPLGGCGSGKLAEEIAAQRKAGDADGARQKALDALAENADRMTVWREVAYCDEAIYRNVGQDDNERMARLVEASLLCAAICGQNNGQAPDDPWKAIAVMVAGDLRVCRQGLLDRVAVHPEIRHERELNRPEELRDILQADEPLSPGTPYMTVWTEADPEEAQHAVYWYARLYPLSWHVPHAADTEPGLRDAALKRLEGWADNRHVPTSMVLHMYTTGEESVETAYARALEDLRESGYFHLATIVENGIVEH